MHRGTEGYRDSKFEIRKFDNTRTKSRGTDGRMHRGSDARAEDLQCRGM